MKRKIVGLIIIFAGFLGLCALVYYLFINGFFPKWMNFWQKDTSTPVAQEVQTGSKTVNTKIPLIEKDEPKKTITFNDEPEIEEEVEEKKIGKEFGKEDLERLSSSFAERFGSYSNQSNFSNVEDLEIYMTQKMKDWSDGFVSEHRGVASETGDYFGITTKAIDAQVLEYDEDGGNAKIKVVCRRRESENTITNSGEVYSQNIVVVMKKEYEAWKVDSAFWEDKQ